MKTKLIMLDTPIIVSDEEVYRGHFAIDRRNEIMQIDSRHEYPYNKYGWRKIIAGIEGLPSINWNGLEEEFGWIDVEKLADEFYKDYQSRPYAMEKGAWREGFKKAQSLNEKKFSLEDMKQAIEMAKTLVDDKQEFEIENILGSSDGTHGIGEKYTEEEIIQSLQQPKVFDIEIETEEVRPKIVHNSIKIIKKLIPYENKTNTN